MKATAPVVELFGPTIQGEGPATGRRAVFVRTGDCNLHCSWCDAWYTWDDTRERAPETDMTGPELVAAITEHRQGHPAITVLTGGEPLMHQGTEALHHLTGTLDGTIHVETNGTIIPSTHMLDRIDLFVVSPKMHDQGDPEKLRLKRRPLQKYAALAREHRAVFKVVCRDTTDVQDALAITDELEIPRPAVWIMPEGTTTTTIHERAAEIADLVLASGANLTLRNHINIWGDARAR